MSCAARHYHFTEKSGVVPSAMHVFSGVARIVPRQLFFKFCVGEGKTFSRPINKKKYCQGKRLARGKGVPL